MDGSPREGSTEEEELHAQRRNAPFAPELIAAWVGDTLHCIPVADLPAQVHADCLEGCAACCPPPKGF